MTGTNVFVLSKDEYRRLRQLRKNVEESVSYFSSRPILIQENVARELVDNMAFLFSVIDRYSMAEPDESELN